MLRATGIVAATAALVAGGIALASPVSAAELYERDALFVFGGDILYVSTSTGFPMTGSLMPAANLPVHDVKGADWDHTTGLVFYVNDGDPDSQTPCQLYSLTFLTGASTLIGDLHYDDCESLDVGPDGTLRIGTGTGTIATISKTDASTLSSITVGIDLAWISDSGGQFFVGDYNGAIYTLDVANGGTTMIGQANDYSESAAFASDGTLWLSVDGEECPQGLGGVEVSDPATSYRFLGDFLADDDCVDGDALFVVPGHGPGAEEPDPDAELPATGPGTAAALLAAGGIALLAGAGVLHVARGRRSI